MRTRMRDPDIPGTQCVSVAVIMIQRQVLRTPIIEFILQALLSTLANGNKFHATL